MAGAKKYITSNKIENKNIVIILCGANMNTDRLRHVSERADIGESTELILGVTIDERPGSFKKFCSINYNVPLIIVIQLNKNAFCL